MKLRTLPCRTHGGNFSVPVKRGRPPVKCGGEYPECDQAGTAKPANRVSRSAKSGWCRCGTRSTDPAHERGIEGCKYYAPVEPEVAKAEKTRTTKSGWCKCNGRPGIAPSHKRGIDGCVHFTVAEVRAAKRRLAAAEKPSKALTEVHTPEEIREAKSAAQKGSQAIIGATVALAMDAKAKLEAEGWTCAGRAWVDPVEINGKSMGGVPWAELIASRGEEMITLRWAGDKLKDQQYSLWNMEQPGQNEMPEKGISSEFDEYTDKELVARMSGQRVTWWNKLGKNKETAECPDSVRIAHAYNGIGDETPADRIVTFVCHNGGGYRSFRVGQLLKIG